MKRKANDATGSLAAAPELSIIERLDWLLAFLDRDLVHLRDGERLDLLEDAYRVLGVMSPGPAEHPVMLLATLVGVQADLRQGVRLLETAGEWNPFDRTPVVIEGQLDGTKKVFRAKEPPKWIYIRQSDGMIERRFAGDPRTIAVAQAGDLLMRFWADLRRCPECQTLFRPRHGHQRYDRAQCSDQTRTRRFTAARQRDHRAEYRKRRGLPAKVRTRPRKKL
jgi:hypothetical protein